MRLASSTGRPGKPCPDGKGQIRQGLFAHVWCLTPACLSAACMHRCPSANCVFCFLSPSFLGPTSHSHSAPPNPFFPYSLSFFLVKGSRLVLLLVFCVFVFFLSDIRSWCPRLALWQSFRPSHSVPGGSGEVFPAPTVCELRENGSLTQESLKLNSIPSYLIHSSVGSQPTKTCSQDGVVVRGLAALTSLFSSLSPSALPVVSSLSCVVRRS